MQFIVESGWSVVVFSLIAFALLIVATFLIFASRYPRQEKRSGVADEGLVRWIIRPGRIMPTLIAFAMMLIGMALVGAWYYVQIPIVDDYIVNILAVSVIAAFIAVVAAYGISLIGLNTKGGR